jgi:N6-L-threonylcarbamoyladenine synthase
MPCPLKFRAYLRTLSEILVGIVRCMIVLGIETSCDETSASVLDEGVVKSNVISSQLVHARYGGVVPELASRAHQRLIVEVIDEALAKAGVGKSDIEGVAATQGPGLVGALLVGLNFGKAFAYGLGVPFVGVNHMEGHLYSNYLADRQPAYPFLALIVSGGHTMLVTVTAPFVHRVLGQTRDDAAGEAFDKVAKMLGLGYPGGPIIDKLAKSGNPKEIRFPRSYLEEGSYDFSFSGIKTAVLYYLKRNNLKPGEIGEQHLADICAGFQSSVVEVLVEKTMAAADEFRIDHVTVAGGVSANSALRGALASACERRGKSLYTPSLQYCMDNGAMIAYVGWLKLKQGITSAMDLPAVANLDIH